VNITFRTWRGPRRLKRRELRANDLVEVRSAAEILATLDAEGKLDGMPFMPEMLRFSGHQLRVYKRADKTCDTTHATGLRRLRDTVHLTDSRCDGAAHSGCQAGCLLYWNERWLRPVAASQSATEHPSQVTSTTDAPAAADASSRTTVERLSELARRPAAEDGSERWMCQATEMFAASSALPWWEPTQYVRDVLTRNATIRQVLAGIVRWLSVRVQWRINHSGVPFVKGRLTSTPAIRLDLQPGDRVRIKSRREIEETLDTGNRTRGLKLDADMMLFCGQEHRVLRRVNRIIDERTGALITIPGDCIVLDGVTCTGAYNRTCPRSDYPYWREAWLSRIGDAADGDVQAQATTTA
jgi:hypothetical protein